MSGHSKWKNIQRTKGANDLKKASVFTKISKDLANAAQLGGGSDPNSNFLLRVPLEKARAANMSNDKVENAIKRGLGELKDEKILYSNTYEAYAPEGTALLIDCSTDNPTRTIAELKNIISKNNGKFLNEGSVSWKFKEVGRIVFEPINQENIEEDYIMKIIDQAAVEDIDIIDDEDSKVVVIVVRKEDLKAVNDLVISLFDDSVKIIETGIVKITDQYKNKWSSELEDFIDKIEELPEVDNVWTDAEED